MSDSTFGVKVPQEMKNELTELMKSNQLSGKEFVGMLLNAYKLEQAKLENDLIGNDINELQRLLQRVQALYLNIHDKSKIVISEKIKENNEKLDEKQEIIAHMESQIEHLKNLVEENEKNLHIKDHIIKDLEKANMELQEEIKVLKNQFKNNETLCSRYELDIDNLKKQLEANKDWEIRLEDEKEQNINLKNKCDSLASEIWFLQREIEKLGEEKAELSKKHAETTEYLKKAYELELKNSLLEQKVFYSSEIEKLKDENYQLQKALTDKIQEIYRNTKENLTNI